VQPADRHQVGDRRQRPDALRRLPRHGEIEQASYGVADRLGPRMHDGAQRALGGLADDDEGI
jgi:hypothetical protein